MPARRNDDEPKTDFNGIIKNIRTEVETVAKLTVRKYRKQATRDARKMLTQMKSDLRRWSNLLDQGLINTEDFEWLVQSQVDSVKMAGLQKAGLAEIRVDHFKRTFINLIIDSFFDFILGSKVLADDDTVDA